MIDLYVTAACGIGLKRQNNEDNLCINGAYLDERAVEAASRNLYTYSEFIRGPLLAAVCDGMGGESAGETASQTAVRGLAECSSGAGADELFARLRSISSDIVEKAAELGVPRIGCTAAVLSLSENGAEVINVGDSRVYLLRGRKLRQLSHDQSEVQSYVDAGLISEKKARTHPMRHRILQYLGMPDSLLQFEPAVHCDAKRGDVFLLCSDGLTECVEDRQLCRLLRSGADAWELYGEAMKYGGADNTTVIVARVE